jgi:fluoride ion exporter CrcB/FEX
VGRVLRKEDEPMGKFLVNVLAAVVAGVIVALIIRFFNV